MADTAPKPSADNHELNRQDVFHEINREIISGRRFDTPRQKTRPNYTYVIFLNILLLIAASLGILLVYGIFREQGIRLTVGTGAIQSLELLLTEQEERRKTEELRLKEEALATAQRAAVQIAGELNTIRSDISNQVNLELDRQKIALTASLEAEIKGKTEAEKATIQERYNKEILRIQEQSRAETERRIDEATRQQQELLAAQQEEQRRTEAEVRILQARKVQAPPAPDRAVLPPVYADNGVSALFNAVERQMKAGNYPEAERNLRNIERTYGGRESAPPEKRSADLFLVSIIREYLSLSNNHQALMAQALTLSNGTIRIVSKAGAQDMAQFRALIEEISLLAKQDPKTPGLEAKMRALKARSPDVFTFYDSYKKYLQGMGSLQAVPLIEKADRSLAKKDYPQAVEQYQNVLTAFPDIPEQKKVLSNLSAALYALGGKGLPYQQGEKLVYMKAPDGYIMDISEGTAVLALMPGVILKTNALVNIFKVETAKGLELSPLGTARVSRFRGSHALAPLQNPDARIGDIIYTVK